MTEQAAMEKKKEKKYGAMKGAPFKKEHAQAIGKFIEQAPDKTTPGLLAQIRENPNHTIHDYIEWDDSIAAQKYRLQQVRNIVEHVHIEMEDVQSAVPIRAFFSVREEDSSQPEYKPIEVAFSKKAHHKQVINRAKNELKNWAERYRVYQELQPFTRAIDQLLKSNNNQSQSP